ncbi:MAG: Cysteine desulfurase [Candidatus Yanofskybacteria bacterium GW2011_GWF1_44_227]|uniref:Cysteine desulfurase n=1 Tax=Candidatus Yanofskybacteria bacterium GW2011_GWE2_40_11 TaxID=1619033 RepID=A0A0G0QLM9_9BACT|nr:MAG: Cysteine desulfurase [Candidatus Yanofskybacteria bacterium GW2011_GWE1_40_10]KKR41043.1 MAG: Cysteine desulfurase [Candidatus Yanofskybacteria bacterium GW2011_GWE2_40_11]KKT15456.1 MAG: Cysteine desulfurase [Candidatus Yanofskybacteria bacterium GW2011_GWF2_43_596]KKT53128.1 MAG: Cysteine desulfurase [Candidatus Yanofskybacteria bacterium GW2011_GWF1_44_227]OGN38950.1 MAG: hypothetical protein A2302_01375 [Candidatus Yanofskybacteria bacterium RIFOXYB2_FULL_44_18]
MKKIDRTAEFPQLRDGEVYADWTGAALPPVSLISKFATFLTSHLLGNPHSSHRASQTASDMVTATRARILSYLNASSDEYDVVFTPNATGAIRILEHFVFRGGELLLTADNHNSVNGLRETAKRDGGVVRYAPINGNLGIDVDGLVRLLDYPRTEGGNKLFAYPAKSNYSGVCHPLELVGMAQERGWYVLLDAAAYNANCRLDLSAVKPDFVPVSFYKMFGFPTGVGCLIIKKTAYAALAKKWFAGGSIRLVSVATDYFTHDRGASKYEDGTINFQMIPAIMEGLEFLEEFGDRNRHAIALATQLRDELKGLAVGDALFVIHSPRGTDTVACAVRKDGEYLSVRRFEEFASERGVHVRAGDFCNPGANEQVYGFVVDPNEPQFDAAPNGSIRISFGYANVASDVSRILEVAREYLDHIQ